MQQVNIKVFKICISSTLQNVFSNIFLCLSCNWIHFRIQGKFNIQFQTFPFLHVEPKMCVPCGTILWENVSLVRFLSYPPPKIERPIDKRGKSSHENKRVFLPVVSLAKLFIHILSHIKSVKLCLWVWSQRIFAAEEVIAINQHLRKTQEVFRKSGQKRLWNHLIKVSANFS